MSANLLRKRSSLLGFPVSRNCLAFICLMARCQPPSHLKASGAENQPVTIQGGAFAGVVLPVTFQPVTRAEQSGGIRLAFQTGGRPLDTAPDGCRCRCPCIPLRVRRLLPASPDSSITAWRQRGAHVNCKGIWETQVPVPW